MKRVFLCLLFSLVCLLQPWAPVARAAVNDFTISNFQADYYLSRDKDARSTLRTVETITAEFPAIDQNHGLERALPQNYDRHSTHLSIVSVTDSQMRPLSYSTDTANDNLVLRIGDKNRYVHGPITYVITYTQRDVTRYFADTQSDEFYWDTNGTQWRVPIQHLKARLHLGSSSAAALNGNMACYSGFSGLTTPCQITKQATTFQATVATLQSGENMTLAIGFMPHTFAAYQPSLIERLSDLYKALNVIGVAVGILAVGVLTARWYRVSNRTKEKGTIVPEYLPPKDTSVTTSASIMTSPKAVFTAQLLDFAVRHYIKIYETKPKSFWSKAEYDIEIIKDISDLHAEERELFTDIFGDASPKRRLPLKSLQNNTKLMIKMSNNDKKLEGLVRGAYGLRAKDPTRSALFKKTGWVLGVFALLTLGIGPLIAAIFAFIYAYSLWPLSDKGLALSRYLDGLMLYIKVAETERLNMLQSPDGAQKVGVSASDPAQLVKLYERVLPYAVLFGQEKEWNKRLGGYYEAAGASPDWYAGNTAFNAGVFSSAMSNFGSSAGYTTASSSSAGGSSGGGSSGGGGGGGGGGGW